MDILYPPPPSKLVSNLKKMKETVIAYCCSTVAPGRRLQAVGCLGCLLTLDTYSDSPRCGRAVLCGSHSGYPWDPHLALPSLSAAPAPPHTALLALAPLAYAHAGYPAPTHAAAPLTYRLSPPVCSACLTSMLCLPACPLSRPCPAGGGSGSFTTAAGTAAGGAEQP